MEYTYDFLSFKYQSFVHILFMRILWDMRYSEECDLNENDYNHERWGGRKVIKGFTESAFEARIFICLLGKLLAGKSWPIVKLEQGEYKVSNVPVGIKSESRYTPPS